MNNNDDYRRLLFETLSHSGLVTEQTKVTGKYYGPFTCGICGAKNKGYAPYPDTYKMFCNRSSCEAYKENGGVNIAKFFNISYDFKKRFKTTPDDPCRPAREYLKSRGLNRALDGLEYEFWPKVRGNTGGAVMFPIGKAASGKPVHNGRLFRPRADEGKTHNSGSTSKLYWRHPALNYTEQSKPIIACESIIDALSLIEMGQPAIAVLSAGTKPTNLDIPKSWSLRIGFDSDRAGVDAVKAWKEYYPDAEVVLPDRPGGSRDWNDTLLGYTRSSSSSDPKVFSKLFENALDTFRIYGNLATATDPYAYSSIHREAFGRAPGLFEFLPERSLYHSTLKKRGEHQYLQVKRCGRFTIYVISFLVDNETNPDRPEYKYYLKFLPNTGKPTTAVATARDIATLKSWREFTLCCAKQNFEGDSDSVTAINNFIVTSRSPEIRVLSCSGYDQTSQFYYHKYWCIDPGGKLSTPEKNGLLPSSGNTLVKPANNTGSIQPDTDGIHIREFYTYLIQAWGHKAGAIFGWMVASWFAHCVRAKLGFFPFLLLHGDPQCGKTAISTILNACQGYQGEGVPITKSSTVTGINRKLAIGSSYFINLCEDNDPDPRSKWSWADCLTIYNSDNTLYAKGVKTNDYQTAEAKFQATLMISSNVPPLKSRPERERACFIEFKENEITDSSLTAYQYVRSIPASELGRFIIQILKKRKQFESGWQQEFLNALNDFSDIKSRRILENFSIISAFHRIFCRVFEIEDDISAYIKTTAAKNKLGAEAPTEFSIADHFFDQLNLVTPEKLVHCVAYDDEKSRLYIHLTGAERAIRDTAGFNFVMDKKIGDALISHPAYIPLKNPKYYFPEPASGQDEGEFSKKKQKRVYAFDTTKEPFSSK